eukprot:COSAG03_NODE_7349_length_930_cov_83.486161_2_plen_160_part_00
MTEHPTRRRVTDCLTDVTDRLSSRSTSAQATPAVLPARCCTDAGTGGAVLREKLLQLSVRRRGCGAGVCDTTPQRARISAPLALAVRTRRRGSTVKVRTLGRSSALAGQFPARPRSQTHGRASAPSARVPSALSAVAVYVLSSGEEWVTRSTAAASVSE